MARQISSLGSRRLGGKERGGISRERERVIWMKGFDLGKKLKATNQLVCPDLFGKNICSVAVNLRVYNSFTIFTIKPTSCIIDFT
jgi:hypothetical protein